MKKFKIVDYWISIVLIAGFTIALLIKHDFELQILSYLIVGGWQVISMLVHIFKGWFNRAGFTRNIYHWITLISLMTISIGSYLILAVTAPFMAVFYTWLCWHEVHVKMKRPLAVLK